MRPLWRGARCVLVKELRDHLRDRRSMLSALIMPMLGPLIFMLTFTLLAQLLREDKQLVIPVRGALHAPNLIAFLERNGAKIEPTDVDLESAVRRGRLDLGLEIPEGYGKEFEAGRSARVQLFLDRSRTKTRTQTARASQLLRAYGSQMGSLRLLVRGVDPELAMPVQVEEFDVSTPEKIAANVLGSVPIFFLLSIFVGGMYLAIDSTAGERERGSLEPLLLNPITRTQVVLGKLCAVVLVSWLALLVTEAAFSLAIGHVPLQELGVRASLGPRELLMVAVVLLPLGLFASALQMLFALFARTYKEAQTYLSVMMVVPMLPAMFLAISPIEDQTWMMAVPVLGQTLLLGDVLRGEPIRALSLGLGALSCIVAAALFTLGAVRMLSSEKIIFGRGAGA